jgi:hypothetical protein
MRLLDYPIVPCTCGRESRDFTDLAVITEDDGALFRGKGVKKKGHKSKVVCMRKGCRGAWKSQRKYVKGLTRILNIQYLRIKKSEKEDHE